MSNGGLDLGKDVGRGEMEERETDASGDYAWKSAHRAAEIAKARGQPAMRTR